MDVHIRHLRYFVAVAEELSFTVAARRLFVSQPALSKQIRQFESSFRATLFERSARAVSLTEAGQALLPNARRVIAQWEDAQRAVANAVDAQYRTLIVGFQAKIGRGLIPHVTATMGAELPQWRLLFRQIGWSDPSVGLAGGEVDVALAWLPVPAHGGFSWKVVATEHRLVALPSTHHLAPRADLTFADLAADPFIALPAQAGPPRDFWLATARRGTQPAVAAEAATAEEALDAIAAGTGIALLPAGHADLARRDDIILRPVRDLPPAELAVLWRSGDDRPAVHTFTAACHHHLRTATDA
ncbi:LysR family transcriptional regulator [Frankia canadensis]|uniref:LysR family transcriptional regulator n=1 Tax=Frankia canadensis TaxID=1836972 RepID=A0A2I2KQC2_9ACTN|nr:LysR family transcriptional regulator [Frankia canadensis]SNQ47864.1 LysR family transcriptional regulator [Frankia canadensis]SOU55154.1 LysR family transcriptional regulator [Frankia canadensis]